MTAVQEVHTAPDMTARTGYGSEEHEESDISVVLRPPGGGGFELGGMSSLRKTVGWEVVNPVLGASRAVNMMMKTGFYHEGDYRWVNGTKDGQSCSVIDDHAPGSLDHSGPAFELLQVRPTTEYRDIGRGHDKRVQTLVE